MSDVTYSLGFTQRGCRLKCKFCLTPESTVLTEHGPKAITEVEVGERVLTHTGKYSRVAHLLRRRYKGRVYRLRSGAVSDLFPTVVTAGHPIWTRRITYRSGGQRLMQFNWMDAEAVKPGHPQRSRDTYAYPRTRDIETPAVVPDAAWLSLTPELMTLVGWYLAEGYLSHSVKRGWYQTTFCLGHSEEEMGFANQIVAAASACGMYAGIQHPSIGIRVTMYNLRWARWLLTQFGTGASEKSLPLWVRLLPASLLGSLIDAWFKGDGWGHVKKGTLTRKITTVSSALAINLREIALKCGYNATINRHATSDLILGRSVRVKPAFTVIYRAVRDIKRSIVSDDEFVYSRIVESEVSEYDGIVCNLEVEGDNSYCTPAFSVHNCVVPRKGGKNRSVATIAEI